MPQDLARAWGGFVALLIWRAIPFRIVGVNDAVNCLIEFVHQRNKFILILLLSQQDLPLLLRVFFL